MARTLERDQPGTIDVRDVTDRSRLVQALRWADAVVVRAVPEDLTALEAGIFEAREYPYRLAYVLVDVTTNDLNWLVERVRTWPRWPLLWLGPQRAETPCGVETAG